MQKPNVDFTNNNGYNNIYVNSNMGLFRTHIKAISKHTR